MDSFTLVLALTAVAGLYMAWSIGANDVANAMGTSVGSGALSLRTVLVLAAIFELSGALFAGGRVSETIADNIVDFSALQLDPLLMAGGMACSLIAAAGWIHAASAMGFPVSTTHSIVGAVLGFGFVVGGSGAVQWGVLGAVGVSWLVSPILGGVGAFLILRGLQRWVFEGADSIRNARRAVPAITFFIVTLLGTALLTDEQSILRAAMPLTEALLVSGTVALMLSGAIAVAARRVVKDKTSTPERLFGLLQIVTACFIAFAHGSNDVANAVGPVAAAFRAVQGFGSEGGAIPTNVLMIGACGIVLGLSTYGFRVMATIGKKITELTPSLGFAAELSAAIVLVAASRLALPVSTTHVVVGAVVGAGLNRSLGALNMRVLQGIAASWIVSVPAAGVFCALLTLIFQWVIA
ncbi:MAG: inorganic phosphate transporter [Polyangiales bacterium]